MEARELRKGRKKMGKREGVWIDEKFEVKLNSR